MRHFFSLWGILWLWTLPLHGESPHALGQWKIREDFQEAMIRPEFLPNFYKSYGLEGLSEQILAKPDLKMEDMPSSGSVDALLWKLHYQITNKTFDLIGIFQIFPLFYLEITRRPLDAIRALCSSIEHLAFPAALCILLVCIFHLFSWISPIRRDIAKKLGGKAHILPLFTLVVVLTLAYTTGQIALGLLVLVFLTSIYSRRSTFLQIVGWSIAIGICFQNFGTALMQQINQEIPREALREGRNRIEYALQDIESLSAVEQASWAFWNQSPSLALQILESSNVNLEKEVLSTIIQVNPRNFSESIQKLEELRKQYGDHKDLIFNLSQLYMESQDLVRAEELRKKIPPEYLKVSFERVNRTGKTMFPITPETNWADLFFKSARKGFQLFVPPNSSDLPSWIKYLIQMISLLFPIFMMASVSFWRKRVSGLCVLTGEATPSLDDPHSKLASQAHQKSDDLDPQIRQRYLQYHRYYEQARAERIRRWTWLLPGSLWIAEENFGRGIIFSFAVFFLLWTGISLSLRINIHRIFGLDPFEQFFESGWSASILFLAFVIYVLCIFRMRRRLA